MEIIQISDRITVLKDGKKSPSEQNIVDIFNRKGASIKDAQKQARKEIENKKKATREEKKELDEFLKKTKAKTSNAAAIIKAISAIIGDSNPAEAKNF